MSCSISPTAATRTSRTSRHTWTHMASLWTPMFRQSMHFCTITVYGRTTSPVRIVRAPATSSLHLTITLKASSWQSHQPYRTFSASRKVTLTRYEETDVIVHTASTQASVRALTYEVTTEHRQDIDLPVTARYRALILAGAKHFGFSESYQQELRRKLRTAPSLKTCTTLIFLS